MCFGTSSGKLSQLAHYGPIGAIILILWITLTAFHCLTKWFPPESNDPLSVINFLIFWIWPVVIFYNYFRAIFVGPGFVPKGWRPEKVEHEKYLQYCDICESFKAPRAHHCKKCSRCVLKLDHHCPWINTCTGHFNHANFCWFMFYAILGCTHGLLMLCPCIYRALFAQYYIYARIKNVPIIYFTFVSLISSILSIGLALGVIFAVGFLLAVQLRSIIRNQTGIESWILRKARDRSHRRKNPFIYPYDLGFKENLRQVFNWRETYNVIGNGIIWPVCEGADEYALTREQIEQKREKRQRTVRYSVIQSYKGSFITYHYGFRTCICIPCSDEARIPIEKGDYVLVTRWEKYWLYGERVKADETKTKDGTKGRFRRRSRGWFPRCCVYEAFRMEDLWSGKLDPDSDVVREQLDSIAPEDLEDYEEQECTEQNEQERIEEAQQEITISTSSKESPKHFGVVEEAEKAVVALNNKEFHGKRLRVELSTSTVRHRPGQPEPASALRNSRARAAAMASGNGVSRYSPAAPNSGVGPMRHTASAWVRSDARPYDGVSMDPNALTAGGYGPPVYDRSRPYDARSDPRNYYNDRRDSGYASGYEAQRDSLYGPPAYAGMSASGGGQPGMYPMRDYRELPTHTRADSMGYGTSRIYDRNQGTPPVDPYYSGTLPQGTQAPVDPYHGYDPYQKYYSSRPRDPEYPVSTGSNSASRDYDIYANYRNDPYLTASGQPPPPLRHDLAVTYQQQQQPGYPPPNPQRQHQAYGAAPGTPATSYPPSVAQYYGTQQRT
ncbi:unnamed protein product [Rotaria magnacalcarata]|uniref:Palmitoyltransferase n=1 Tax=Rotaria magnacalcarata TaxID=392030 RepID=A0A8S2JR81_9BILA|nr:unnamed protein product [Rotaria magnacalcarata]